MTRIYKILRRGEWATALAGGLFEGSVNDRTDGFIHFSTAGQASETARRHFQGQSGLLLLAVDAESLEVTLRWEPSRGGALFPHLYGPLACDKVIDVREVRWTVEGIPDLGELVP